MTSKTLLLVIVFLLIPSIISAKGEIKEINVGPKLEICIDSQKNCYLPEEIEYLTNEKNLLLRYSIINDGAVGWICWNNMRYEIRVEHEGEEEIFKGTNDHIRKNEEDSLDYCLEPKQEFYFFVPFNEYNLLDEKSRNNGWTLTPRIIIDKLTCFKDFELKEEVECKVSDGTGKRIKLEVSGEVPSTGFKFSLSEKGKRILLFFKWFIGVIITALVGALITVIVFSKKGRKKKKIIKNLIISTIIFCVVELCLFLFFV